ncbi:MAG: fasciclin domain-containing protein [Prolixibacteraceae bacterium]
MKNYRFSLVVVVILLFSGCSNVWEEHTKINDNVLEENIFNYLESNTNVSEFSKLLKQSGMDVYLNSSGIYTVFVPNNQVISSLDQTLIDSDEKIRLFVANHITNGMYSTLTDQTLIPLKMKSGKTLQYDGGSDVIDGIAIKSGEELTLKNGVVQFIDQALAPRYTIWEFITMVAPSNKFIQYLESLTESVFDVENSALIGVNDLNEPIYDSIWIDQNKFFLNVTDLSSEDSSLTLLIPSDEVFDAEFTKYERFYRRDDKASNEFPTSRDSVYIKLMIAKDMVFEHAFSETEAQDTLISYYEVKVPFNKTSVTLSYQASNGYVHMVSDCPVKISNKILPIVMEAENCITGVIITNSGSFLYNTTSGIGNPYFRERPNASNGFDLIVDNSHKSETLSGALFVGPVVASIRYRVKIRAINDFNKSYRNPSSDVELKQMLGQVTITRSAITDRIKAISTATNALNSGPGYGTADVVYDPTLPSSYYIPVSLTEYSPRSQAFDDEIDLGYYNFAKSDSVYLRLIPESPLMAVTADYFRLVPVY